MFLDVLKYPNKALRGKNKKIEKVDSEVRNLVLDMIETMKKADGVGLAAPQVGVNKNIVVVDWDGDDIVLINPKIKRKSWRKNTSTEGCLSLPKLNVSVKRHNKITVTALDYSGDSIKIEAEGLLSRILQHEIDHLNGVLILDKCTSAQKSRYKNN